ncbi:MAG: GHKL domain-containing protein [Lachnospiraceae bacterium]|nr:GHKL domain-containing protein [Lachnospiraceae bacterium]
MEGYITAAALNGWNTFCCILFFRPFSQMRAGKGRWKIWAAMGFQILFCMMLEVGMEEQFYARTAAASLVISAAMLYVFKIRYLTALVLAMFFLGLDAVVEYLSVVLAEIIFPLLHGNIRNVLALPEDTLIVLGGRLLLFFSILLIAMAVLVIDYVVYYLIDEIIGREIKQREDEVFRERVKCETAMYHSISENLDRQRKRAHEYKNQIAVISALASGGQYEELLAYVKKADAVLQEETNAIDANHVIVNAILNTKYKEATAKGIVFVLKVNDLSNVKICEEDIVLILSNLLNNAIEACERAKEKVIKLKFMLEEEQIIISVKNSMAAMPMVEDGRLQTTKTEEPSEHGMGIRNVIETVADCGGKYTIHFDEDGFLFSILLPNPADAASE